MCGVLANEGAEYCPNCSSELELDLMCPNCDEKLDDPDLCEICYWESGDPLNDSDHLVEDEIPEASHGATANHYQHEAAVKAEREQAAAKAEKEREQAAAKTEKETAAKKAAKAKRQKERVERVGKKRGCLPIVIGVFAVFAIISTFGEILDACEGDENTAWPEGFDQRVAGVVFED